MTDAAYFCPLSHEGVLAVRGPDAAKFLQGQLTCNLAYIGEHTSSLGARCTPKGRMQSSFRIVQDGDGYLLAMATELLPPQLENLSKYAAFSKSRLSDESERWNRFGLSGADEVLASLGLDLPQAPDSVARQEGLLAIRLSDGRTERLAHQAPDKCVSSCRHASCRCRWSIGCSPDTCRYRAGLWCHDRAVHPANDQPPGTRWCQLQERLLHGPGNRGAHAIPRQAQAQAPPAQPDGIRDRPAEPGRRAVFAYPRLERWRGGTGGPDAGRIEMLVVLQEDAAADGRIYLGSPDGLPLTLLTLPYTLNPDQEIQR